MATADSSIKRRIWTINKILTNIVGSAGPLFPNRVKRRCPAIIFAVNRIAKVPGRMIFLIVSIHTIKGIKTAGVPNGTK